MKENHNEKFFVRLIEYGSSEYLQACELRYELFFAKHNLPWSTVFKNYYPGSFYAAIILQNSLVAYAELVPQDHSTYRICQMVVHPHYQRQNFGRTILLTLIELAKSKNATSLILNSRLSAIAFYEKLGFHCFGTEFPSTTTGVMHIAMGLTL